MTPEGTMMSNRMLAGRMATDARFLACRGRAGTAAPADGYRTGSMKPIGCGVPGMAAARGCFYFRSLNDAMNVSTDACLSVP